MGKETPNPPQAPPFFPIDIPNVINQALQYDTAGFDWSDQDFISRFPGLVATRNQQMNDAYRQLTGPLDLTLQQDFTQRAIQQSLGATGGGNASAGLEKGSFAKNQASVSFAQQLLNKQDVDRSYFDQLIGNNPQRAFGLSGSDVTNLNIANTGGLNSSNQQAYQAQLAGIYGAGQQGVATGQQIAALGALLGRINSNG